MKKLDFSKASDINEDKSVFYTTEEWNSMRRQDGAKIFINKVFGLRGRLGLSSFGSTTKPIDELAEIMYSLGMASSYDEGKRITQSLDGIKAHTGELYGEYIHFTKVVNSRGNHAYRCGIAYSSD
jgi:hypothetical protein